MRIAHLLVTGGWGGAERLACALAREAQSQGNTVIVDAAPLAQAGLEKEGFDGLGKEHRLLTWAIAAHLRLKKFKPNVVHVHLSTPAFAAAALVSAGCMPSVYTLHLLPEGRWPNDFLLPIPSGLCISIATRKPVDALLVAVSQSDGDELQRRVGKSRIRRVLNSPTPPFEQTPGSPDELFGGGGLGMLAVGRLERQKGFDRLISALGERQFMKRDFTLVIIGSGPERAALQAQCKHLGLLSRVHFAGNIPARPVMQAAHILICASRYEGMPLVPMEAVLEGCPVVASPIAPHRELFGEIPGALLPEDTACWAEFLDNLVGDPAALLHLKETQAARAPRYSFQRMWQDYLAIYHAVSSQKT